MISTKRKRVYRINGTLLASSDVKKSKLDIKILYCNCNMIKYKKPIPHTIAFNRQRAERFNKNNKNYPPEPY